MKYELLNGWKKFDDKESVYSYAEGYKAFLNAAKTERESISEAIALAEKAGFREIGTFKELKKGDKVYIINKNKAAVFAIIGEEPFSEGINIVGSHVDAPRLDLKQNPLFEEGEMAFLKTHYYGGIKKYQWTAVPLALHGVVVKENGEKVNVSIGDEHDDITFVITDLLPHLAREQMKKSPSEIVEGEDLNLLIGSIPLKDSEKDGVKENILKLLFEKYNICEEDFLSAELEAVPAANAKDVGFDRSLVGAYAHDDRVCAYANLKALLDTKTVKKTAVCLLTDKEEVGSMGNTGAKSSFFSLAVMEIMEKAQKSANSLNLLRTFNNSVCLSADVNAGFDPKYASVFEKNNMARLNYGITMCKYTGGRGKSDASDASAELVAKVRGLFNKNNVLWHSAELGKIDIGGGGTIAQYMANLGIDTIDCGVPVLSMHAPYEVISKLDAYMTYKAFYAFFNN